MRICISKRSLQSLRLRRVFNTAPTSPVDCETQCGMLSSSYTSQTCLLARILYGVASDILSKSSRAQFEDYYSMKRWAKQLEINKARLNDTMKDNYSFCEVLCKVFAPFLHKIFGGLAILHTCSIQLEVETDYRTVSPAFCIFSTA